MLSSNFSFLSPSFPSSFLGVDLGVVTPLGWYLYLMVKFYLKRSFVSIPHSSNHDLNVEALACKYTQRWNTLYHKKCQLKRTKTWQWAPLKHGYQKFPSFILGLLTMKVKTWLHPWTRDEISKYLFQNMITVEEFCNLPSKHKLTH
jgi:hypothetical protein